MILLDFILGLIGVLFTLIIVPLFLLGWAVKATTEWGTTLRTNWRDAFSFHRSMRGKTGP